MEVNKVYFILIFIETVLLFVTRHFFVWVLNYLCKCVFRSHIWTTSLCNFTPLLLANLLKLCHTARNSTELCRFNVKISSRLRSDELVMTIPVSALNNSSKDFSVCFRSLSQISFTHWLFKPSRIWCTMLPPPGFQSGMCVVVVRSSISSKHYQPLSLLVPSQWWVYSSLSLTGNCWSKDSLVSTAEALNFTRVVIVVLVMSLIHWELFKVLFL